MLKISRIKHETIITTFMKDNIYETTFMKHL